MKLKNIYLLLLFAVVVSACNDAEYVNAIPDGSKALVSVDVGKMSGVSNPVLLKSLLHVSDLGKSGIDLSRKIYLFEDAPGNLGLCAGVQDEGRLEKTLQASGQSLKERRGVRFAVVGDSWIAGFSDRALLVMGPVAVEARAELQNQMARYLKQDEEASVKGTPMFDKLDSITSPMAMVAQVEALPEKFAAPFILGAPKNTDPSEVYIAAGMSISQKCLMVDGEPFSLNRRVNDALRKAMTVYRPIKGRYVRIMDGKSLLGIFLNVEGTKFLPLMKDNAGLQALLTGINTAIDMDNIIRSIDGDMAVLMPSFAGDNLQMSMSAELANSNWLADVDYWKKSCPKGGRIADWGPDRYYYEDGKSVFYFGVSADRQFMSGSSREEALASVSPSGGQHPLAPAIQKQIIGRKMAMVVSIEALGGEGSGSSFTQVSRILRPLFGDVSCIVYSMK